MLLPTKGISPSRALLTLAGQVASRLDTPRSVTDVWNDLLAFRQSTGATEVIGFDWFALALTTAYTLGLVELTADGRLSRR